MTVIPATRGLFAPAGCSARPKRRVAGYARVSTESDEQFTSYAAQVDYYTQFIHRHADWEFVKVYTDEGISGLGTRNREGFNEMIRDALAGEIDLIVTKSVSRFARNTVDSLVTIRKLKEKGVEVYFEKENIYSLDGKGELLLTIMSSLAQEESRSISENVTWGQRKRFSDGKVSLPYKQFLGYERGEKKGDPPVVNKEQAVLVRRIYSMFMEGRTAGAIAKILTEEGVPTPSGKALWRDSTVNSILQNEKYRGSALLQKCFTTDFLTKKRKINEGEIPQYYIENSHEAIIRPEEWDAVQDEIARRRAIGGLYRSCNVLSAKIKCGDCGGWYGAKVWHSTDKYRARVWQCNRKFDEGKPRCRTPHLQEEDITARFLEAYSSMITDKTPYIEVCRTAREMLTDTKAIDAEMKELCGEMEIVAGLTQKYVQQNAATEQDQTEFNTRYNSYVERYEKARTRYEALKAQQAAKLAKAKAIDRFTADFIERNAPVKEFDDRLWLTVLEYAEVHRDGRITFHFFGGTDISN